MNKQSICFLSSFLLVTLFAKAQFTENFSDGNITANPTWMVSSDSDWIVNSSFQLQSNNTISNSTFYLSTPDTLANNVQWELYADLAFNTSSANYVDIYLTASESDIMQSSITGYFVRLGNANDNICLYRKDSTAIQTLITGKIGVLNHSNNALKIKVIRDSTNQWALFMDTTGTGNNYVSVGNSIDSTYTSSSYFGILVKQSTSSFFKHHFFDDIVVKPYSNDTTLPVIQYFPEQYDVVIDEIMCDPTPQVGLPNNEWIELKNTSASTINLQGWTINSPLNKSGPLPNFILQPDSFVIVCTGSAFAAMSLFGPTISITNFPSLNNTGDEIFLNSPQGQIIHAVNYSSAWYQNELKENGGWSLEMIDTKNPCSGSSNWRASIDPNGGTPGKINSVNAINPDQTPPHLLRAYASDSLNIILIFDEPLDSMKAATADNYTISEGIGIPQNAVPVSPLFNEVDLKLTNPLIPNKVYTVTANGIADCVGNIINGNNEVRVGLISVADSFDVVINEVLFNPKPAGVDYVELYNRSNKIINLKQIYIANRNSTGIISSIVQLIANDYLLFPQDFIVATENPDIVKSQYIALNPDAFVTINSMPSFNDDNGDVIILNLQGNIVDELQYDANWQFPLIDNPEGVALERIDYNAPTQSQSNWHSAATNVGYGTPTYKNSQYRIDQQLQGEINVSPSIFSPDNDGIDDFATIEYNFPEPGYVANITIFDEAGRPVRYLEQNALCGIAGNYRWDGLGDKSQKLPIGIYIIYTEIFNLNGKTKEFKNTIVLARKD